MSKGTKLLFAIVLVAVYSVSLWGILGDSPIGTTYMFAALAFVAICVTVYLLWPSKKRVSKAVKIDASTKDYIVESFSFTVKGVTFKNGNQSRQAILKKLFWDEYWRDEVTDDFEDESLDSLNDNLLEDQGTEEESENKVVYTLRKYEFEGSPAIGVYANDDQIGNVPKEDVPFVLDILEQVTWVYVKIYGGGTSEDGQQLNFGANATVWYHKPIIVPTSDSIIHRMTGTNGRIHLYEDRVIIEREKAVDNKLISMSQIVDVQLGKADASEGNITIYTRGGQDTVSFDKSKNKLAVSIKNHIEKAI